MVDSASANSLQLATNHTVSRHNRPAMSAVRDAVVKQARRWIPLDSQAPPLSLSTPVLKFGSYNVLAQCLIKRENFPYASKTAITWKHRSARLLDEIKGRDLDVLCMQEVDSAQFWETRLGELGYTLLYHRNPTKQHGIAIAFKHDKVTLDNIEQLLLGEKDSVQRLSLNIGNVAQVAKFSLVGGVSESGRQSSFVISNMHLCWRPFANYIRVRQALEVMQVASKYAPAPYIMCGDWNTTPDDALYSLATIRRANGDVPAFHMHLPRSLLLGETTMGQISGMPSTELAVVFSYLFFVAVDVAEMSGDMLAEPDDVEQITQAFASFPLGRSAYSTYRELDPDMAPAEAPPAAITNGNGHVVYEKSSPYWGPWKGEPLLTHSQPHFKGTLDYIILTDPDSARFTVLSGALR